MAQVDTVRIKSSDVEGGILINKNEFDEKTHKLFDGETASASQITDQQTAAEKLAAKEAAAKTAADKAALGASGAKDGEGADADTGDDDNVEWTLNKLMKLNKDDLVAEAKDKGLDYPTPDEVTKETIAQAILDAE